jgi:hypothetical protein
MNIRTLVAVSGLVALGAAPLAAQAHGSQKAADACIQAFVDNYLPKNHPVNVRKQLVPSSPLGTYAKQYTIDLSARLAHSGNQLVSVRCVANSAGQVIALEGPPPSQGTELGARLK